MKTYNYKIGNNVIEFDDYIEIINPETNEAFAKVPALSTSNIDTIYNLADSAKELWSNKSISERASHLLNWCELLETNKEDLASTLAMEVAKPLQDGITEINRTIEYIKYTIEEMYRIDIEAASSEQFYGGNSNKLAITKKIPIGTVLAISPFNYPINLAVSKIAPALISGNTVVFKPATQGSVVGIKIVELLIQTKIPAGVINIVTGRGRVIGDYLVTANRANMISFTGGTGTGKTLSKLASMTPQVLELGGKDAAIILNEDNLDFEFISNEIVSGAFNYSGQRCTAIKRILVPKRYEQILIDHLVPKIETLTSGSPIINSTIVPLISSSSADYVQSLIDDAKEKNANILTGGNRNFNLIDATLITNVDSSMKIYDEEPFGPVLPIITYETIDELIQIHNQNEFGLQATVFGNNIDDLFKISGKLEAGTINFNGKTSRGPDNFPFVGHKQSGVGVQGIRQSIESMMVPKTIVINIR